MEHAVDEVNMCKQHTATAITFQAKLIEGCTFVVWVFLNEAEIFIPLVTDDVSAREAPDWDDHFRFGLAEFSHLSQNLPL